MEFQKVGTSLQRLTTSSASLTASMVESAALTEYAAKRARLMFGCFRKGEANDPDTYVAAITATLSKFPREVITAVTHPTEGLPIKQEWLPSVKNVYDACEAEMAPIKQRQAREKRIAEQFAERDRFEGNQNRKIEQGFEELQTHLKSGFSPGSN